MVTDGLNGDAIVDCSRPKDKLFQIGGVEDTVIEERISSRLRNAISNGNIKEWDLEYLSRYRLRLLEQSSSLSDRQLELTRRLTIYWDIQNIKVNLSSHRRFVGWVIVLMKRFIYPIIRAALKEEISKQREFNGALIELLAMPSTPPDTVTKG